VGPRRVRGTSRQRSGRILTTSSRVALCRCCVHPTIAFIKDAGVERSFCPRRGIGSASSKRKNCSFLIRVRDRFIRRIPIRKLHLACEYRHRISYLEDDDARLVSDTIRFPRRVEEWRLSRRALALRCNNRKVVTRPPPASSSPSASRLARSSRLRSRSRAYARLGGSATPVEKSWLYASNRVCI